MIRAILFAALFPLLIVVVWDDAPQWVILVGWGIGAAVLSLGWWRGNLVMTCPYCHKRVKMFAQVCYHCGRQVTNTAAPGYRHDPMEVLRECPHCKSGIRPDASYCAHCQQPVQPWRLDAGSWWDQDDRGVWMRLDQRSMQWVYDRTIT